MKKIIRPFMLASIVLGLLILGLKTAQARRFAQVDGSNYFDIVRVCRDGIEIGFARNGSSVSVTGAWWVQESGNVKILNAQSLPLASNPVPVPGGTTVSHSDYFTLKWTNNTMLQPGHRMIMALNETSSQDIWATVGDCLVDDGRFAAEWWVFPDTSQSSSNGGTLPDGTANFQITVVMTQPIADVNVAMFVENDSTGDVLTLTASLTSPEGTTVQLFSQVGDQGKNFGARCREQNQNLIGDPLADLVLDDVSLFDFTTPDVFRSFETPYAIQPQQPLDAFRGENGNGVWTLQLQKISTTPGSLRCWMLQITDGAAPNPVVISGPAAGAVDTDHLFTAVVQPISTTLPLTMTWEATEQDAIISQTLQLTDTAAFSWSTAGPKTITVTADNGLGTTTDTFQIAVGSDKAVVYLPSILRQFTQLQSKILAIGIAGDSYTVSYQTTGFVEQLPGTHLHFFYNTVPPSQAGVPGSGPWMIYGGPSPFTGYPVSSRPGGATQMCVLVANPDHTVRPESGNCYPLP